MEPPTREDISYLTNLLFVALFVLVVFLMFYPTQTEAGWAQIIPISRWSQRFPGPRSPRSHREVQGFRRLVDVAEKWDGQAMDQTMGRNHAPHNTIMTWGVMNIHKLSQITGVHQGQGAFTGEYIRVQESHDPSPHSRQVLCKQLARNLRMISSFN